MYGNIGLTGPDHFHRTLCERIRNVENVIPDREHFPPYALKLEKVRREGAFQLRTTFLSVFLVLNAGWEEHGVLIVCGSENVRKRPQY